MAVTQHKTINEILSICPKLETVGKIDAIPANDERAAMPWVVAKTNLPLKVDIGSMDLPFFGIRGGRKTTLEWSLGDISLKMKFGPDGQPSVREKDLWIFSTTQLMAAVNSGWQASPAVRFKARSFLLAAGWGSDGQAYRRFNLAVSRLKGTVIETNAKVGDRAIRGWWGLIESAGTVEEVGGDLQVELVMPGWLVEAVRQRRVLTLDQRYFELAPLARVIYQIARLRCGSKKSWVIGTEKLHKRSGSNGTIKEFKRALREMSVGLPGYRVTLMGEQAIFSNESGG